MIDPEVAELLCPNDHPYGGKRAPFDMGYYETFNLPHVRLVDARKTPIVRITGRGIATTAQEYECDVIVLATGFDIGAGALERIGVLGRGNRKLIDHWAHGQRAYLGMATHGFPNLFHINGPQGPSIITNNLRAIEDNVEFVGGLIAYMEPTITPRPRLLGGRRPVWRAGAGGRRQDTDSDGPQLVHGR